jgi:hypothetical protein
VPDGLPFHSEQEALSHVFKHHLGEFFTVEEYEAEPPSGSFQLVHRCGMTGELIGPPNFHRYQAMLREHHASRLAHVSLERVQARLESVREPEVIAAWLEKMKRGFRYTLKQPEGASPVVMEDFESARFYLLTHMKEKLVRPAYSVRFFGKDLHLLPPGDVLRRSIEALHQHQLRFPLETANNLRGRLRRLHLAVYKRGSKGVSFVCAVKRRFREPGEVLAENLADLIAFLEAHPNMKAADLPREYLGMERVEKAPATSTPAAPASPTASDGESPPEAGPETSSADAAAASVPPEPPAQGAPMEALSALKRDLRYLVTQGYVVEYSDGRLQVPPVKEMPGKGPETSESKRSADHQPEAEAETEPGPDEPAEEAPAPGAESPQGGAAPAAETTEPVAAATEPVAEATEPHPAASSDLESEAEPPVREETEAASPEAEPTAEAEVEPTSTPETPPDPLSEPSGEPSGEAEEPRPREVEPIVPVKEPATLPPVEEPDAPTPEPVTEPEAPALPSPEEPPTEAESAPEAPPHEDEPDERAKKTVVPTEPGSVRPKGEEDPL